MPTQRIKHQNQPYACFYVKCQDLATGDIQTYVFYQQEDLLAFAQASAKYRWAILKTEIRFFELHKWYPHLSAEQRDGIHFAPHDYADAIDGKAYLASYQP